MFCQNCGSQIEDGTKFCENCGAPVEAASAPAEEAPVVEAEPVVEQPTYTAPETDYSQSYDATDYTQADYPPTGGKKGFAIASMICGIVALLCCCSGFGDFALAIAAVVLGIITLVKGFDGRDMALTGVITGAVGLILALIMGILSVSAGCLTEMMEDVPIPGMEDIIDEMDL